MHLQLAQNSASSIDLPVPASAVSFNSVSSWRGPMLARSTAVRLPWAATTASGFCRRCSGLRSLQRRWAIGRSRSKRSASATRRSTSARTAPAAASWTLGPPTLVCPAPASASSKEPSPRRVQRTRTAALSTRRRWTWCWRASCSALDHRTTCGPFPSPSAWKLAQPAASPWSRKGRSISPWSPPRLHRIPVQPRQTRHQRPHMRVPRGSCP
mmetsp:Transcript_2901/g.7408  ORF Transcript_2901/g.7408 Transcript_2901/m.7408 type:complete len:212 (+) Transcript_2901:774-1409(+)